MFAFAASVVVLSCSNDSPTGPGGHTAGQSYTLALTSVSGARIPAVYFADTSEDYRSWADSGTLTVQADRVVAIRLYESATTPLGAPHATQSSQFFFASGHLTSDSTFEVDYSDSAIPDIGTINHDGSVSVAFTGILDTGTRTSFGKWIFASAYHGVSLNLAPRITSLAPSGVTENSPDTTILISGTGFMPTSTVSLAGNFLKTTFVSVQQLQIVVPAVQLTTAGTLTIIVTNPAPGGGSYYYPFVVTSSPPVITSLSPSTVAAGSVLLGINITGNGFDTSSVVLWNGAPRKAFGVTRTNLNVSVSPADIAVGGVIQIAVTNSPPGGGTSASLPFTVTGNAPKVLSQVIDRRSAVSLAGDPVRSMVYAGLDSVDPTYPNSVTALDGATGDVVWSMPVTGRPDVLSISDDGQFLYVATLNDSTITRIALANHTIDLTIPTNGSSCPTVPRSITVVPGTAHSIAVQGVCTRGTFSGSYRLAIYDDSIARPASVGTGASGEALTFGESAAVMYGLSGSTVYQMTVDGSGVGGQSVSGSAGPFTEFEFLYLDKKLYMNQGTVYDPATKAAISGPSLYPSFSYSITGSSDGRTLYVLSGNQESLEAFDLDTNLPVGGVATPGIQNMSRHLVRWGSDGLAFISGDVFTGGYVYLIRSDFVH